MRATDAAAYINGLAFKPGWQPYAEVYTTSMIMISFMIDTVNTSYPDPDGTCRQQIKIYGQERMVNVRDMDETDLCAEVLKCAADNDSHENREFLKVRQPDGSWKAPLHPHTTEGNRAWDQRRSQPARRTSSTDALLAALGLEG